MVTQPHRLTHDLDAVTLVDWLALAVVPGGLVVLAATCLWASVALTGQGRNMAAAVVFLAFLTLVCVLWLLYNFFTSP